MELIAAPAIGTCDCGPPQPGCQRLRVLVAEDDASNQQVLRLMLERRGYRVRIVDNGRLALAALAESRFDLLLVDVRMPEVDGFHVVASLRRSERDIPGSSRLPVIAVTAMAAKSDRQLCMEAGADEYLSKPFRIRELYAAVDRALGNVPLGCRTSGTSSYTASASFTAPFKPIDHSPRCLEHIIVGSSTDSFWPRRLANSPLKFRPRGRAPGQRRDRGGIPGGSGLFGRGFVENRGGLTVQVDLDDFRSEQQGERPIDHDPEPTRPTRHLHQVIGAPEKPSQSAAHPELYEQGESFAVAQGAHHSEGVIDERPRRLTIQGAQKYCGPARALRARRALGESWVGLAIGRRNRKAIADRPHLRAALGSHGPVDHEAVPAVLLQREFSHNGVGGNPRRQDDGVRLDRLILQMHDARFNGMHLGAGPNVRSPPLVKHLGPVLGQLRVDLRHEAVDHIRAG